MIFGFFVAEIFQFYPPPRLMVVLHPPPSPSVGTTNLSLFDTNPIAKDSTPDITLAVPAGVGLPLGSALSSGAGVFFDVRFLN